MEHLREAAEKILISQKKRNDKLLDRNLHQLFHDLSIHQIELELQNEILNEKDVALQDAYIKFKHLYEFAPIPYYTLDSNGLITEVNQSGAALLGLKKESLLNRSFTRYISAEFQSIFSTYRKLAIRNKEEHGCQVKLLRKNGPFVYAHIISNTISNPTTNEKELLICINNITQQKDSFSDSTKSKLIKNLSTNSNSEICSFIIHEINNPLCAIANYLYGSMYRLESGSFAPAEIIKTLKKSLDQTQRIAEIILRMKNFICKGNLQYEYICFDNLIRKTIKLIEDENSDSIIPISFRTSPDLPQIWLDPVHLQQALIHIIRNAIEALLDAKIKEPKILIDLHSGGNKKLEIVIADNGPGIEDSIKNKLFSPHFTTKKYGLGLGLIISKAIIDAHGGNLKIQSNVTGGTCITIDLFMNPTNLNEFKINLAQ